MPSIYRVRVFDSDVGHFASPERRRRRTNAKAFNELDPDDFRCFVRTRSKQIADGRLFGCCLRTLLFDRSSVQECLGSEN
jgi:hypothetical protein